MGNHMPMFSTTLAVLFGVVTIVAVGLHVFNQWREERLYKLSKERLVTMFRVMERNMAIDCGIMLWMSAHALGWLNHEASLLAGWSIFLVRAYITSRAYARSKEVYGL